MLDVTPGPWSDPNPPLATASVYVPYPRLLTSFPRSASAHAPHTLRTRSAHAPHTLRFPHPLRVAHQEEVNVAQERAITDMAVAKQDLSRERVECTRLQGVVQEFESNAARHEKALALCNGELAEARGRVDALSGTGAARATKLEEATARCGELEAQLTASEGESRERGEALERRAAEAEAAAAEQAALGARLAEQSSQRSDAALQLAAERVRTEALEADVASMRVTEGSTGAEVDRLRAALEEAAGREKEVVSKLEQEVERARCLEAQLDNMRKEARELQESRAALAAQHAGVVGELAEAREGHAALAAEHEVLRAQHGELGAKLEASEASVALLEEKVGALKSTLKAEQGERWGAAERLAAAQSEGKVVEETVASLREQVRKLQSCHEGAQAEAEAARAAGEAARVAGEVAKAAAAAKREALERALKDGAKRALDEEHAARLDVEDQLRKANEMSALLETQCISNHQTRDKALAENQTLHGRVAQLESEGGTIRGEAERKEGELRGKLGEARATATSREALLRTCGTKLLALREGLETDLTCMNCLRLLSHPVTRVECGHQRCRECNGADKPPCQECTDGRKEGGVGGGAGGGAATAHRLESLCGRLAFLQQIMGCLQEGGFGISSDGDDAEAARKPT